MAMLNKWTSMKSEHDASQSPGHTDRSGRRPYLSSLCSTLSDAEFWRKQIVGEISRGVSEIQNKGMAEHLVRDLNDKINKLMREKYHWNRRVKDLGGPDWNRLEAQAARSAEGDEGGMSVGSKGYRYFGMAKELPGVKEMFQKKASVIMKRGRDVKKIVDGGYFGIGDEEDGVLEEEERREEEERWGEVEGKRRKMYGEDTVVWEFEKEGGEEEEELFGGMVAKVEMPSQDLIQKCLREKKKREVLESLS